MSLHREACSYLHFQQELFWSVYLNALKMEIRCFIKLALDLSAVGLHMFTALSSTRQNNLGKLKYSQRLAAIETTNATLITYTCYYVIGHTSLDKNFLCSPCSTFSISVKIEKDLLKFCVSKECILFQN